MSTKSTRQDISFKTDSGRFNYRVGAVLLHEGKVLLLTEDRFDFWYLPGGRGYMFEPSDQTIIREVQEELGETPKIERLLWTTEKMYHFAYANTDHHEIAFYYLIHLDPASPVYQSETGIGVEAFSNEETTLHYRWFPLNQLDDLKLVPPFMKKGLLAIPSHPEHVILNELMEDNQ